MLKKAALFLIRVYRNCISPYKPACCRFVPTCSAYAYEAFEKYGFCKGLYLSIRRILKCHPFHKGGYDLFRKGGFYFVQRRYYACRS